MFRPILKSYTVFIMFICVLSAWVTPESVVAMHQINIVDTDTVWPDSRTVDINDLRSASETLETIDPNFTADGATRFTGVRLSRLMSLTGTDGSRGLTVIGADQYVGFLSHERLAQGFLVWEMDNGPIHGLKGGPLKIMFPESAGVHLSCYTWYVKTLVAGPVERAVLPVTVMGQRTRHTVKQMLSHAVPIDPSLFSIAQGCRNEFKGFKQAPSVSAVPLSYFLPLGGTFAEQVTAIEFKSFSGPTITLSQVLLDYPVYIMLACDGRLLHPALGGPFSVVFPVEKHPGLQDMVPESGALFFLQEIVVR